MTDFDSFWESAYRSAYHSVPQGPDLYPIEKEALLDLCLQHADFRQDDTWWAAVGELREDGASVCKPLTLARLDVWVTNTWNGILSPNWSMSPEKEKP